MKKILLYILSVLIINIVSAQSPQKFNYQAVVRDSSGNILAHQPVSFRISILLDSINGGAVYVETQNDTTNSYGLSVLRVGDGNPLSGSMAGIIWANGPYFIKVELDQHGGNSFTVMGTTQLISVPYALHSRTADSISGILHEADPVFNASVAHGITASDTIKWETAFGWGNHANAGYLTAEADGSVLNEIQTLSISQDTVSLSNGGKIRLPDGVSGINIINDSLYIVYSYGQTVNAGYIGNGSPGVVLPSVSTISISNISYYQASVNATVTNNGNEFIIMRGICLSRKVLPDLNDTVYSSGNGSGSFVTTCDQLAPDTKYYVRAFATNTLGTTYGAELSFTTLDLTVPQLYTDSASNITNSTAISGGTITDNGGTPILVRGICWSLSADPTLADNFVPEGTGMGHYIALMTGLTGGTTYHVRAYASNAQGTSYGNDVSFSTVVYQLATVTTAAAGNISYTTANSGGNVSNDNGSPVTSRGICWATSHNPTTANSNYSEPGGLGVFSAAMTGLTANTTYYVRAFAVNGGGTSYGNEVSFTTLTPAVASITTKPVSGISSNIAGSGGVITTDGGSPITAKGVCWSQNPSPTLVNSYTSDGSGAASYNSTMSGLNPLTIYYVRAYATNGLGTAYGNQLSFTTTDLATPGPTVPVVGTSAATMSGSTTANGGGYVSSDGESTVSVRGLCWNNTGNPTLADSYSADGGTGTGYFTSVVTGLSGCGNVTYIKAYATNSTGTGYGNLVTVTTGLVATVMTDSIVNIGYYDAVACSHIADSGGCAITQKGVCWSYNPNPTTGNAHTSNGPGGGSFVSNITGLYANRTYYLRPYAINSAGTSYGPQQVFTTATPSTPYLGQSYAGGLVFYVDGTGLHGLVCAPSDQGYGQWGCTGTSISGTGTAVGTGAANTAAIVAGCAEPNIAAKLCDNLVLSGYSDWVQPSRDDLILMFNNLRSQGLGGFMSDNYWSSSEYNGTFAWRVYFGNGGGTGLNGNPKNYSYYVRAVRAF